MRTDTMRHSMNAGKERAVLQFIRDYRSLASQLGRVQWRLVFEAGGTRKTAPAKHLNAICGAAAQMASYQVAEQINGWLSNCANEFSSAVQHSKLAAATKYQLHVLNRASAVYRPDIFVMKDGTKIAPETRRLARNIMRHVMGKRRRPNLSRISPRLDRRVATISKPRNANFADLWVRLKNPGRDAIAIPLQSNHHFVQRGGELCPVVQLCTNEAGRITVRLVQDMAESFTASRAAYEPKIQNLGVDFGLRTLFATSEGDLLGRDWLTRLSRYDAKLQPIAKHMQRIGKKPRDSKRFRALVDDIRGFVKTEVNRVLNHLVTMARPANLVLEKLDFRNQDLGRRLNRMLANCGRAVIKAKLRDLEQRFGIISEEVNPAFSSQQCEACGFVSKNNRRQDKFACLWCGHTAHADVHGARNIRSRRSGSPGALLARTKMGALGELACWFGERMKTQANGVRNPSVGRGDAWRRSAFAQRLKADQIAWALA